MGRPRCSSTLRATAALAALLFVAAPRAAAADEQAPARRFAPAGQVILSVDRLIPLVSHTREEISWSEGSVANETHDTGTSIAFVGREPSLSVAHTIPRLAIDVAVADGFTIGTGVAVGVGLGGDHTETRSSEGLPDVTRENAAPNGTILGFAPRLGYAFGLARTVHVWPRLGFSFYSVTSTTEESSSTATTRRETTDTLFALDLDAPVVWAPIDHVAFLAGPLLNVPLMGAHATELSQAGIVKERTDQLRVLHLGVTLGLAVTLGP